MNPLENNQLGGTTGSQISWMVWEPDDQNQGLPRGPSPARLSMTSLLGYIYPFRAWVP